MKQLSSFFILCFILIHNVSCFANGDVCSEAIPMELNQYPNYDFNYLGNYADYNLDDQSWQCGNTLSQNYSDVWFTFTALASDLVILRTDATIELYKGENCSNLNFIKCIANDCQRIQNFEIGALYYMRLLGISKFERNDFQVSVHITPPGPFDTDCNNPHVLTPRITYFHDLVGCNNNPIDQVQSCSNYIVGDIWYAFDVKTPFYDLDPSGTEVQLYKDDCLAENLIFCQETEPGDMHLGPLDVGSRYLVRIGGDANTSWQSYPISVGVTETTGAINDFCTNPTKINTTTNETVCQRYNDYRLSPDNLNLPPCWTAADSNDGWYIFDAKNTSYNICSDGDGTLALYSGGDCNNLTLLGCGNDMIISDLIVDESYLIRTTGEGLLCLTPTLMNDICIDAIELFSNQPAPNFDYPFYGATLSTMACESVVTKDMWFRFEAPSTRVALDASYTFIGQSNWSYYMSLYEGSCQSLELKNCSRLYRYIDDLEIGKTYYLRISTELADHIQLSLASVPENRTYQNAIELFVNSCEEERTWKLESQEKLWYIFNPVNDTYTINVEGEGIRIHRIDENGEPEFVAWKGVELPGDDFTIRVNFIPGETYYFSIDGEYSAAICITEMNGLINDTRFSAIQMYPNEFENCYYSQFDYSLTSFDLWESGSTSCDDYNFNSDRFRPDAWYYFVADRSSIILDHDNRSYYQLYKVPSLDDLAVLPCPISEGFALNKFIKDLEVGGIYLIRLFQASYTNSSSGSASVCLQRSPTNPHDAVGAAVPIIVSKPFEGCGPVTQNYYWSVINSPTAVTAFMEACNTQSLSDNDVWFSFIATDSTIYARIPVDSFELYEKLSDGFYCHSDFVNNHENFINKLDGLTPGKEYFIRITQPLDYCPSFIRKIILCLYENPPLPPNATIETAMELTPSDNLIDCQATDTLLYNGDDDTFVWFKFTATSDIHQLQINSGNNLFESQLYKHNSNGELILHSEHGWFETISTNHDYSTTMLYGAYSYLDSYASLNNYLLLEVGRQYYVKLRINPLTALSAGNQFFVKYPYTACLKTPPAPPPNDYFLDAESISVATESTKSVSGAVTMSVPNYQDYPQSDACLPPSPAFEIFKPEAWYTFMATDTSLSLFLENKSKYPQDLEWIADVDPWSLSYSRLELDPYFSLYHYSNSGEYIPVYCEETIDQAFILENLIPSDKYYIKIYYDCLTYLTELDFCFGVSTAIDNDGDGSFSDQDCDDDNPLVYPGQIETPYNGIDDDCDTTTPDDDLDQDGFLFADDCDDNNANINPSEMEKVYNGMDDDCDITTLDDDLDQDGFLLADDCDDNNPNINPGQVEDVYNGVDDDCDILTLDDDLDQDGFLLADDCDDRNAEINPDAADIPNNDIDEDCDGVDGTTGVHELAQAIISIFPNPTVDLININVDGQLDYQVQLFDLKGKIITSSKNTNQLKIADYPVGTYLLEIRDLKSSKKIVERIVLVR